MRITSSFVISNGDVPSKVSSSEGYSLGLGSHLMHKLDPAKTIKSFDADAFKKVLETSTSSPEEARKARLEEGQKKTITAVAYLDGKPVMMVGKYITTKNSISHIPLANNGNAEKSIASLKEIYGARLRIEYFNEHNAPTNAEAFELFNQKSFKEFVDEEFSAAIQAQISAEREKMHIAQQQLNRQNTKIQAIFRVNGKIVASFDENERTNINHKNLMSALDDLGISREVGKDIYQEVTGKDITISDLQALFAASFGDNLTTEQPSKDKRPTMKDIESWIKGQRQVTSGIQYEK